jgi:hypothetical protein
MKKLFNRIYKRFKVRLNKIGRSSSLKTYEEVELHEKTAFKICVKLISDKDSDFMIAPMSQKRFIINEKLNLFILIDYGRVEITNHIFHYDVRLSNRDYERITYLYDTETEKRRSNTEITIKSNIKNTLDKVYEAIIKETQKNQ